MRRQTILRTIAFVTSFAAGAGAQDTTAKPLPTTFGRITGRILDSASGLGVTMAAVHVVGTTVGTTSGVDGRYSLNKVGTGPVTVLVKRIGFGEKQVTGLYLNDNDAIELNITLGQRPMTLAPTVVAVAAERGSVNAALDAQMTAVGIINSTTAEQIAKSPDGNAAQAAQRMSGINVGDNNTLTARGLPDKYTISNLNGARIPSPDPEKRIVPLDLFPSGLLQSITTSKTFTPDLQGDFAGALVDIKTKEFPARRMWTMQLGQGYSSGATGSKLIAAQSVGGERFGMASSKRELPALLQYLGNFEGLTLTQADQNNVVQSFRNAWTPSTASVWPNASGSASFGGNDPVLFGHRIGYLVSGSFSSSTDLKNNHVRALANRGNTRGEAVEVDRFVGQTASQSVLWGGLLNASTLVGNATRLSLNALYNRTADNDARIERGSFENEGIPVKLTRMQYVERAVRSVQLVGEHQTENHTADWAVTSSAVRRDEPDRSAFAQAIEHDTPGGPEVLRWMQNSGAIRTFATLDEKSNEARLNYQFAFGGERRQHSLKVGGLIRNTDRAADTREYSIYSTHVSPDVRALPAEQLFDGRFTGAGDSLFNVAPLALGGSYDARDELRAAYGMASFSLTKRIRVIAGARYERDRMTVIAQSTFATPVAITKNWDDVLPSLTVNVVLGETQQIRFAASRTLARPEYRELTPVGTREVLNGEVVLGNDKLERARILNADIRWEWYRTASEVLSVAVFAKHFDNPIERVYRAASSGQTVFFINADAAENYGTEIEWRQGLGAYSERLRPLSVFSNLTLMRSEIRLGETTEISATNLERPMMGQAPYVINGGLTYTSAGGATTATLLYNRVGERIEAAGESPLPDVVRQARTGLDFSLRFPIVGSWSGRFDARNLLDSPVRTTQGSVVREEYRFGRVFQAGIVLKP